MPQDEIKETFLDEIEQIENDEKFQKLKKYWDNLDDKKKLKYYQEMKYQLHMLIIGQLN